MKNTIIDSHCHLNFPQFKGKLDEIINRALDSGVSKMLTISTKLREINDLVEKTAKERNLRYKDSLQEILVENINSKDNSQLMGRTRTNRLTFFPKFSSNKELHQPGEIVNIKINEIRPFSLTGSLL